MGSLDQVAARRCHIRAHPWPRHAAGSAERTVLGSDHPIRRGVHCILNAMADDERQCIAKPVKDGRKPRLCSAPSSTSVAAKARQAVATPGPGRPLSLRGPWRLPRDGIMGVRKTRLALKRGRLPQSGTLLNRAPTDELHKGPGCASVLPCCTSCSSARPRRRPPAGRRRCLCAELSGKTTTEASPVTDGAYFVWAPASRRKRWRRACLATKPKPIPLFCYLVRRL